MYACKTLYLLSSDIEIFQAQPKSPKTQAFISGFIVVRMLKSRENKADNKMIKKREKKMCS